MPIEDKLKEALQAAYYKGFADGVRQTEEKLEAALGELEEYEPRSSSTAPPLSTPINRLGFSERACGCLVRRYGFDATLDTLLQATEDDLLAITNFGQKTLDEVVLKLEEWGLQLRDPTSLPS